MKYICVDSKVEKTRGGREYAVLWFKINPTDKFEKPERLVSFSKDVVEHAKIGLIGIEQEAEVVMYPLGRKFKYPNGTITEQLRLFCLKTAIYETMFADDDYTPIIDPETGLVKERFVKWAWVNGYSPEELAVNTLHFLTPV
jgi:hypothetical protein